MKYLLDTQALIWAIERPTNLTSEVINILESSTAIYVSVESLREIAIKHKLNEIKLSTSFSIFCKKIQSEYGVKIVNTELNHILEFYRLNTYPDHKDPFDHLIISTAIVGKFIVISADRKFKHYVKQGLQLIEL